LLCRPADLTLRDASEPEHLNPQTCAEPESRWYPPAVYELVNTDEGERPQIDAQDYLHRKTYDIKDATRNIVWLDRRAVEGRHYQPMNTNACRHAGRKSRQPTR
jgi:electron-transferring-flavoprotein dehydrogenase